MTQTKTNDETPWSLYVLSCADGTLYTGIAISVEARLHHHNFTKKGAKYTSTRRPVSLLFSWDFENRSLAMKAEIKFKKLSREKKFLAVGTGTLPF